MYSRAEMTGKINKNKQTNKQTRHHLLSSFLSLYQAAVTIEISILLICFCSFELFCPLLDKDRFIENVYFALSCSIK